MTFTKVVKSKTTSQTKSYSNKSETISSSRRNKGVMSPRTNLEQGWLMKNDLIRQRYLDELVRDAFKYHLVNDPTRWSSKVINQKERPRSRSVEYFPKDRVRLRSGRIERVPIGYSNTPNYRNVERVVPINYLGGHYFKPKNDSISTSAILPKGNPRDTLSHRGNFLHFIA